MQAIILAGGFGTRLQTIVKNTPKPMAPIDNRPFLFYLLSYLKKCGFKEVILSVGYLKEQIKESFGNEFFGLNIKYAFENEPLGTGGAIINSLEYVKTNEPLFVLNGDTFLELDYKKLIAHHNKRKSDFTIALNQMNDCSRYGMVKIDKHDVIVEFEEKSPQKQKGLINGGIYVINPKIFSNYNLEKRFSFETDFLTKFTRELKINAYKNECYFIDIGIPEDYHRAQKEIPAIVKNKALFLDRDGVINIDYGYVHKKEDFHFINGIFELCQKAQNDGYLIIIVTNQSGIAKGYYTEEQFLELTKWMEDKFKQKDIFITKTYYCPYHTNARIAQYKKDSQDRKPNPGMLLKAIKEFNIDPRESILIGDKESDVLAAKNAQIKEKVYLKHNNINNQLESIQL
jgi:D,D-heptose 1,7-bisphosphate phosphatase